MGFMRRKCHWVFNSFLVLSSVLVVSGQKRKIPEVENLPPGTNVLWTDPGDVGSLDFLYGSGGPEGQPLPPFSFIKEETSGTNPKVLVKDGKGVTWSVKWGEEASPELFCNRLVWACGYVVETEYYVAHGQITGAHGLKRASNQVQADGNFIGARFQLRASSPKFLTTANWSWVNNPFMGTPQLNGLKVLVMLLSNWDTKDFRDIDPTGASKGGDSNLAIFQEKTDRGVRYLYFVNDWGASLGHWGRSAARDKWNCSAYLDQTPQFVRGVKDGLVEFGYAGKHESDIARGIRVEDARWLLQYMGRVTDNQLRRGLAASGATPGELECYAGAIRQRIDRLKSVSGAP